MIGQRFAIHAGKKLELDEFEGVFVDKVCGPVQPPYQKPNLFPLGAVVGVATLDRAIALQHGRDELSLFDERFQFIAPATMLALPESDFIDVLLGVDIDTLIAVLEELKARSAAADSTAVEQSAPSTQGATP
jgi:hypothetical protein